MNTPLTDSLLKALYDLEQEVNKQWYVGNIQEIVHEIRVHMLLRRDLINESHFWGAYTLGIIGAERVEKLMGIPVVVSDKLGVGEWKIITKADRAAEVAAEQEAEKLRSKDIHTWFGLSYAEYLVIPRSVLQSMPENWQHRFTQLLEEMPDWESQLPKGTGYKVQLRAVIESDGRHGDIWAHAVRDDLANYDRGRRRLF